MGKKRFQFKVTVRRLADDLPKGGGGMKSHGCTGNGNPSGQCARGQWVKSKK